MLFNSLEFFIFLPLVFVLYWFVTNSNLRLQNALIVVASYVFYGWWDWRFLSLIVFSTLVDYVIGIILRGEEREGRRKFLLWTSLCVNLGFLGFFKYYNFFVDNFVEAFSFFGQPISKGTLNIVLPVGISFYTFQTLSYTIDVYRRKLEPTKDFVAFAAFVSFFPQLVAGPIERATNLLPQISMRREFKYNQAADGVKLIIWGLFKKVAIADALAPIVDDIFANAGSYPASTLFMGAVFFGFQIYGDFSGYSDIAIGTAKLFGIELMSNFKFPYFSRDIAEFWRRWHISLSTWFRDYLYIPLGGSRVKKSIAIRNVFIIFLVSGFWHGANWTFIIWGAIHALMFIPLFLFGQHRRHSGDIIGSTGENFFNGQLVKVIGTFILVTLSWIFFRAESVNDSFVYIGRLLTDFSMDRYNHPRGYRMVDYFILLLFFIAYEYIIRKDERRPFNFKYKGVRLLMYILIVFTTILFYDSGTDRSFIYFQF
ncbi:MBOAT family protein [Flagellimonas olearia]|uniref:MBOAT family protein n=1 Tax=Flagellimonas olearia TaxID=552546 RepID=A0A6I1E3K8_9FLAO|nr:MBOAT family O-acyltransferase [Allomuricauda olearia]KAB7530480.1 MBOAT family protein [Allomuricauda olearia]